MTDSLRRAQGDVLEWLGIGPHECDYHVISSGPHWRLREYTCQDADPAILIVPAPIKRPYVWDLGPSVSAVRQCLERRLRVYLLEWMPPSGNGQQIGLEGYADRAISEYIARISSETPGARPFLMGHSLGGTFAAIFGALERQTVRSLVLLAAPLCFASGSSKFRDELVSLVPQTAPGAELVPGSLLSQVSALASPDTFVWARLMDAALSSMDPPALEMCARVERWALDEVPVPGRLIATPRATCWASSARSHLA